MGTWRRKLAQVGLATLAFLTLTAEDIAVGERELECEQAVAHLAHCCPNFPSDRFNCVAEGCDLTPDFTTSQSQCIERIDCDTLASEGWCDAAKIQRVDGGLTLPVVCR